MTARVRAAVDLPITTKGGVRAARMFSFSGLADSAAHVALRLGVIPPGATALVRIHSECLTGDVFGSQRCDCGPQLEEAIERIEGRGGYLLYLRQEGRGIGLYSKLDAYRLQDRGLDTFEANRALGFDDDPRDYGVAAEMLAALGVREIDLLTGNPEKTAQLSAYGIDVRRTMCTHRHATAANVRYLAAKSARGHRFGPTVSQDCSFGC